MSRNLRVVGAFSLCDNTRNHVLARMSGCVKCAICIYSQAIVSFYDFLRIFKVYVGFLICRFLINIVALLA